ncbi:MAG: site-2 protease family protein [Ruminococcus sp.]|jgi:Zn-dependent protease|nr:site-2 protease family protein [Ruminococcus sp.]
MIKLKFKDTDIIFRFTFFAVAAIFLLFRDNEIALMGIAASLIHEFGHIFAMKIFGVRLRAVEFYLLGIKINKSGTKILPIAKEFLILIAGILLNIIISVISLVSEKHIFQTFGMVNAAIGLFNLFPIGVFDGGQIKELLIDRFSENAEHQTVIKTSFKIATFVLIAGICIYLLINKNITAAITLSLFALFDIFDER